MSLRKRYVEGGNPKPMAGFLAVSTATAPHSITNNISTRYEFQSMFCNIILVNNICKDAFS
jgi:hypothetical protein